MLIFKNNKKILCNVYFYFYRKSSILNMSNQVNIAVVGGGVIGTTVAKMMQDQLKGCNVTIIADKYNEETVSYVAAGMFRPGTSFKGATYEITKKWIDDSWNYWNGFLNSPQAPEVGVMSVSAYIFSKQNAQVTRNHFIEDLVPVYRPVDESELKLAPPGTKYGSFFSSLKVECNRYIPYTTKAFLEKGGNLVKGNIESFASLSNFGNFDLVFNCTGLGAQSLCNDHDLVPIRGQLMRVKAPWVKTAVYGDYDTYIIPGFDGIVTLGGVRQYDSYNLEYCRFDAGAISERCYEMMPSLEKAEVLCHKVGLRPHRTPVRVEPEIINGMKIVHCYGHGGYGVMNAPGTSKHAVEIGIDLLKSNVKTKL